MREIVFDSNILIDLLNDSDEAQACLEENPGGVISAVTWIEVMAVLAMTGQRASAASLLSLFEVIQTDADICAEAAKIRQLNRKIKLPDAIILATARTRGAVLMTRNVKDFDPADPGINIPYRLPSA